MSVTGCSDQAPYIADIREGGELRFITRNSPSTYYLGPERPLGFEYDLARKLADEISAELVIVQAFTLKEMFSALERGEADIAGAGLTLNDRRQALHTASAPYGSQRPQVIYKSGNPKPRRVDDLRGKRIVVLEHSSHEALLEDLREALRKRDEDWLSWTTLAAADPIEALQYVDEGSADVAVVDSRDFIIAQNLVPRLDIAFSLASPKPIVWYLPKKAANSELLATVNDFLERQSKSGALDELRARYFGRDESISRVDTQTFVARVQRDLRSYQQLIEIVAREEDMPWELLAAISYQESHWDPLATSRTGVRGMMMLTQATAGDLEVSDRTDPAQSLRGGARYFHQLRERLPADIFEPDRSWLALAAYNIGMGHLEDARVLTERRGGDPHIWADVMTSLPLLEDATHYTTLRYGYARGWEAVRYVQNIRHYYNVLRWQSAQTAKPQPPADVQALLPPQLQALHLKAL